MLVESVFNGKPVNLQKMLIGRNKVFKPNKDISSAPMLFKEKSQNAIFHLFPLLKQE